MILAVLDARAGLGISGQDVYLNVAGGLKITEPAADLAASLPRSFPPSAVNPCRKDSVYFGEIGLSGEIRPVPQAELRLKEAAKLGFKTRRYDFPPGMRSHGAGLRLRPVKDVAQLLELAGSRAAC